VPSLHGCGFVQQGWIGAVSPIEEENSNAYIAPHIAGRNGPAVSSCDSEVYFDWIYFLMCIHLAGSNLHELSKLTTIFSFVFEEALDAWRIISA
jgi:hypothetical protein